MRTPTTLAHVSLAALTRGPLIALAAAMSLALTPHVAAASAIGAFFDPEAQVREAHQPQGAQVRFYLFALLYDDAVTWGITGAEFRMDGFPATWWYTVAPNPAATVSLGDPLGDGCNIAFAACQSAPHVLLYTVDSGALDAREDVVYRVVAHRNPSNPQIPCPVLVGCDVPDAPRLCVPGLEARVNRPDAIEPTSWSHLKALYE